MEGELGEFRTTDACRGKGDAGRDVLPTANRGRHIQRESLVTDEQQALLGGQPVNSPMGTASLSPSGLHGRWVDSVNGNG